jgi:hypothetical protein
MLDLIVLDVRMFACPRRWDVSVGRQLRAWSKYA